MVAAGNGQGASGAARRLAAIASAIILAGSAYAFPIGPLSEPARRLGAVLALVGTLWVTEAIPLSVTALLGPALTVLVGVTSAETAFAAFGSPILMLFVGSFLLARATFKHRLSERIAYRVLSLRILGSSPTRAFVFLGLTTALLSAWMSNTATTAMMLPIAQSVLLAMTPEGHRLTPRTYAAGLMLMVAYSGSLGGLFTPIGTPPNLIGLALIEQATGTRVPFLDWVADVFPIAFASLLLMMAYFAALFRKERSGLVYDRVRMAERYAALGRWRPEEKRVMTALAATVTLWLAPPLATLVHPPLGCWLAARLPEAVVPLLVASVLFGMRAGGRGPSPPLLELGDVARIDWPVIVLFGGGMCLGDLMIDTGFARTLGDVISGYVPSGDSPLLVAVFCLLAIGVSEVTSNTASANMVVPVVVAVTQQVGGDPVALGLAATVACTFGFMLPVSTPTNAMAYATGRVTQRQMMSFGIVLDLLGVALLSVWFGVVLG
jgi:sodium-dependent dicarboxylate transporter 2/3/5